MRRPVRAGLEAGGDHLVEAGQASERFQVDRQRRGHQHLSVPLLTVPDQPFGHLRSNPAGQAGAERLAYLGHVGRGLSRQRPPQQGRLGAIAAGLVITDHHGGDGLGQCTGEGGWAEQPGQEPRQAVTGNQGAVEVKGGDAAMVVHPGRRRHSGRGRSRSRPNATRRRAGTQIT